MEIKIDESFSHLSSTAEHSYDTMASIRIAEHQFDIAGSAWEESVRKTIHQHGHNNFVKVGDNCIILTGRHTSEAEVKALSNNFEQRDKKNQIRKRLQEKLKAKQTK